MERASVRWLVVAAGAMAVSGAMVFSALATAAPLRGGKLTEQDLRTCMGLEGADAAVQVEVCTRILKSGRVRHPHQSDYMAWRAAAYLAQGKTALALADLDKALTLQDKPAYRFQRALVLMARASLEDAVKELDAVMKATPDFAPAWFMRGAIAYRQADYPLAVTYFDGAVTRLPTYYQAIHARGVARMKAGEEEAGRKDIAEAAGMSSHAEKDVAALGIK